VKYKSIRLIHLQDSSNETSSGRTVSLNQSGYLFTHVHPLFTQDFPDSVPLTAKSTVHWVLPKCPYGKSVSKYKCRSTGTYMLLQNAEDMYQTTCWMMIELQPEQHRLLSTNILTCTPSALIQHTIKNITIYIMYTNINNSNSSP